MEKRVKRRTINKKMKKMRKTIRHRGGCGGTICPIH